jgi:hypothetical protein
MEAQDIGVAKLSVKLGISPIDKKLLPKKIKKSFFSVVRTEFRLA